MKNVILFIYRESLGELNVALPIIDALNKQINDDNIEIFFYINSKKNLKKIDNTYRDIINDLGNIFIGKLNFLKLLKKLINKNIYLLTSDKCPKFEYMQIKKFFPSSTKIMCLHAPIILYKNKNEIINTNSTINNIYKPDFFLVGNKIDYENNYFQYNKYSIDKNKILFIGYLNYKIEWINYLLSKEIKSNTLEKYSNKFKKTILVTTRGPHKQYLEEDDYIYQVNSILEIAKIFTQYLFIIKPHPREKRKIYKNAFSKYKNLNNLLITNENTYKICSFADLVISFWSSVIQDCSIIGKPVIEFHRHSKKNSNMLIKDNEKFKSFYEYHGFCKYTDNKETLIQLIKKSNNTLAEKQTEIIENIFFEDSNNLHNKLKKIITLNHNKKINTNFSTFKYIKNLMNHILFKK